MSNQFLKLRRSAVPGRIPTTSSIDFGEIALNTFDGLAFIKKSGSNGEQIVTIGSGTSANISGSQYYVPVFSGSTSLVTSSIYDSGSFTAIGATATIHPDAPERLFVDASDTDSYNLISGHGTINNYLQLNVKNFSSGITASSDIVATADNGDESSFFINMGVNSSGYNLPNGIGQSNDAYLYSTAQDLLIGNASAGKRVIIFNGSGPALDNARIYITSQGTVGINASDASLSNPEALLIEPLISASGAPTDYSNLIIGRGTINESYLQLNIINRGSGSYASADIVATNNAGTETSNYIDMGINSSNHTVDTTFAPGGVNDTYLLSTGRNLLIGSSTSGDVALWTGANFDDIANAKLTLRPTNRHSLTGSLSATQGFTGSLFGTASWALNAPNIYNTDGTLTGNRTLSISSSKLIVTSTTPTTNYTFTLGTPTGVTAPSWPANQIKQGEFNISSPSTAEIETTTYWGRNQTTAPKDLWVNQIIANVTAESTGRTSLYNQLYTTTRGSVLDTSLSTAATLIGTWNKIGHTYTSAEAPTASIVTSELRALYNDIRNYAGTITNAYGIKTNAVISNTTSAKNSAITNFYGYYLQTSTGTSSGPTGSITNLYGIYLDTPIVGATGTITNRWGIYAPDTVMNHFIGGKVGIGTTSPAYTLDVNGTARVSAATSGTTNYSLTVTDTNSSIGANILLQFQGFTGTILRSAALGARIITTTGLDILSYKYSNGNVIIGADENNLGNDKFNVRVNSATTDGQGITLIDGGSSGNVGAGITWVNNNGSSTMAAIRNRIQSGFNNSVLSFSTNNDSNVLTEIFRITETQNVLVGSTTNIPSAILAATSTTKGFLPPRMTNAQRTTISTPAVGLIVYCTDTTEGLYVYKSTGWTFIV